MASDPVRSSIPVLMEGGTVIWRDLFTGAELDRLERYCDTLELEQARLTSGSVHSIRTTKVAWVHRGQDTEFLYQRIEAALLRLNAEHFRSELSGLATFQYAVYQDSESAYFDWHNDYGRLRDAPQLEPRKLTASLQLSDGASYEGCDLQVRAAHPIDVAPRERGTFVAFRANALHRVTPITRGVRKSLVFWAVGPEYR